MRAEAYTFGGPLARRITKLLAQKSCAWITFYDKTSRRQDSNIDALSSIELSPEKVNSSYAILIYQLSDKQVSSIHDYLDFLISTVNSFTTVFKKSHLLVITSFPVGQIRTWQNQIEVFELFKHFLTKHSISHIDPLIYFKHTRFTQLYHPQNYFILSWVQKSLSSIIHFQLSAQIQARNKINRRTEKRKLLRQRRKARLELLAQHNSQADSSFQDD